MFRDPVDWWQVHERLIRSAPQPPELAAETAAVLEEQSGRVQRGFEILRQQLEAFCPDALVVLASDFGRVFTWVQVPQFATFLGEELWGSTRLPELGEHPEDDIVRLPCAAELAAFTHRELVEAGFDLSYSQVLRPLGQPDYGSALGFVAPARLLMPRLDVPVVPIYVNCHVPPSPSGGRCYAFGRALTEVLRERPERVAVFACGGLSHDHFGPRAGWVDTPFDQWALNRFARGKGADLHSVFNVESDTLRGGSAQLRLWAVVAGACEAQGGKATIVDYFPSYTAATGIAFASWTLP